MSRQAIVLNRLTKNYGKHRGINDLSFSVNAGEIFRRTCREVKFELIPQDFRFVTWKQEKSGHCVCPYGFSETGYYGRADKRA